MHKQATELLSKPILKPHEGQKIDSAHPAIYPTGNLPEKPLVLQKKIFLILLFAGLWLFSVNQQLRQTLKKNVNINGNHFGLTGTTNVK